MPMRVMCPSLSNVALTPTTAFSLRFLRAPSAERIVNDELCKVQPVHVDLETETERRQWRNISQSYLVQASRIRPELFVAEGVVPEDLAVLALHVIARPRSGKLSAPNRANDGHRKKENMMPNEKAARS